MKIENDIIRALQQDEAHRKPKAGVNTASETTEFESLLAGQLQRAQSDDAKSGATVVGAGLSNAQEGQSSAALALLMQSSGQIGQSSPAENAADLGDDLAAGSIEKLLTQWDKYAKALSQKDSADLRGIYALLQGMSAELKELKSTNQELLSKDAALGSLVNELDVLTTTESIKFNRGDYL
jgi:hypothetical protein